jgi:hypothetical protein
MSRRRVSADEPGWTWEYGWDPARRTYYARLLAEEGPGRRQIAHFGAAVGEISSVDSLMYLMGVRLTPERSAVLEDDRLTDSEEVEVVATPHCGLRDATLGRAATTAAGGIAERPFPRRTLIPG